MQGIADDISITDSEYNREIASFQKQKFERSPEFNLNRETTNPKKFSHANSAENLSKDITAAQIQRSGTVIGFSDKLMEPEELKNEVENIE